MFWFFLILIFVLTSDSLNPVGIADTSPQFMELLRTLRDGFKETDNCVKRATKGKNPSSPDDHCFRLMER